MAGCCRLDLRRLMLLAFVIASLQLLWLLKYVPRLYYKKIEEDKVLIFKNNPMDSLRVTLSTESHIGGNLSYVPFEHRYHPSGICHLTSSNAPKNAGNGILIIGASSFIGANIARAFHQASIPVIATEDSVNIRFDPLAWYRWEQLISMGVAPQYVNYSDHEIASAMIKKQSLKTIVYLPTPLLEGEWKRTVREVTELHEDFVYLLEYVKKASPSTKIVLITNTEHSESYLSLIKLFELSLSVYNRLYNTNIAIVKTKGVYGPWYSTREPTKDTALCFVDDLVKEVQRIAAASDDTECQVIDYQKGETSFEEGVMATKQWQNEYSVYLSQQTKDIIASPFFTTKRNAQYPIEFMTNNYYFLENWFKNIYKMNLNMVVHHDDLSDNFVSTFKANYPKGDFDKIKDFKDFRPNDRRYLAYYDYMLAHPEIRRIVMTDMRDVIIQNNPFEVMDVLGDRPYVGLDRPFFEISKNTGVHGVYKRCFDKAHVKLDYSRELEMLSYLNSGVTGGTRHVTLAILTRFLLLFRASTKDNCNMAIVGYIYHKYYFDEFCTGWPFNTAFITNQPNIPGLAVLHKWDLQSYN